jgi:methionyl-tRNA formyltransferase
MKERILICAYRDWADSIYRNLEAAKSNFQFDLVQSPDEFDVQVRTVDYKLIFFVGWSWIVDSDIIDNIQCVCLHPSPLPKYRGGCPIQHQIINGEKWSTVTLFLMDAELDHGPILWQEEFSLEGSLWEVFTRISSLGLLGIGQLIDTYEVTKKLGGADQDHSQATTFKRRKLKDSEIKPEDLNNYTAEQLHNKIRALDDPYPNAYVTCKDGTRLYIKQSQL